MKRIIIFVIVISSCTLAITALFLHNRLLNSNSTLIHEDPSNNSHSSSSNTTPIQTDSSHQTNSANTSDDPSDTVFDPYCKTYQSIDSFLDNIHDASTTMLGVENDFYNDLTNSKSDTFTAALLDPPSFLEFAIHRVEYMHYTTQPEGRYTGTQSITVFFHLTDECDGTKSCMIDSSNYVRIVFCPEGAVPPITADYEMVDSKPATYFLKNNVHTIYYLQSQPNLYCMVKTLNWHEDDIEPIVDKLLAYAKNLINAETD